MSADDKLRAILAAEAAGIEPGAEGWDRIRSAVAARRRRRAWLRVSLAATTAVSLLAVVAVTRLDGRDRALDPVATPTPSVSTSGSPSASPTPAPVADAFLDTVWPFTQAVQLAAWAGDHGAFPYLADPVETARQFGLRYLGMPNAAGRRLDGNRVELTRRSESGENARVTVVTLRAERGAWLVVSADKGEAVQIAEPAAGSVVTEPLAARGPYREPDPVFHVELRGTPDARGTAPLVAKATARTAPPQEWSASLSYARPSSPAGSLLVTFGSNLDGGLGGAVAIPVRFTGAASATPPVTPLPATFVGVSGGQLAVFSTSTGNPVAYLTSEQPGGGAFTPSLSDDGTTVVYTQGGGICSSGIWSVGAGGGEPTVLVPAGDFMTLDPVRTDDGLLAYLRTGCSGGERETPVDLVLRDTRTGSERRLTVRGQPLGLATATGSSLAAYLGVQGSATTVRYVDVRGTGPLAEHELAAPAGCAWTGVTIRPGGSQLVAAVDCAGSYRVVQLSLDGGDHETLLTTTERVFELDFDGSGSHLLLVTSADEGESIATWRWSGSGPAVRITDGELTPTW